MAVLKGRFALLFRSLTVPRIGRSVHGGQRRVAQARILLARFPNSRDNHSMSMSTAPRLGKRRPVYRTLESLFRRLGPIPPARIRLTPPPGMAEEHHVIEIEERENRLCELVDGVLIEKDMASFESLIAVEIIFFLRLFLEKHDLGIAFRRGGHAQACSRPIVHTRCLLHFLAAAPRS